MPEIIMSKSQVPAEVQRYIDVIDSGLTERGDLTVDFRRGLHMEIERVSQEEHERAGYYRRVKWAIGTAYRTLPIWNASFPGQLGPEQILELACRCIKRQTDMNDLEKENNRLFTTILNLSSDSPTLQIASASGLSCYAAASTVLYDLDWIR